MNHSKGGDLENTDNLCSLKAIESWVGIVKVPRIGHVVLLDRGENKGDPFGKLYGKYILPLC